VTLQERRLENKREERRNAQKEEESLGIFWMLMRNEGNRILPKRV